MADNAKFNKIRNISFYKLLCSIIQDMGLSFKISLKASKFYFALRAVMQLFIGLRNIILLYISKVIIDTLMLTTFTDVSEKTRQVTLLVILNLVIEITLELILKFDENIAGIHRDKVRYIIDTDMIRKACELDLSYFDQPKFYNTITNANNDSTALETLAWLSVDIIRSFIQFFSVVTVLSMLNWLFPVFLIILSIPAVLHERSFTKYVYNWGRSIVPEIRKMMYLRDIAFDKFHAKDVRLYCLLQEILSKYKHIWDNWFRNKKIISINKGISVSVTSLLPKVGSAIISIYIIIKIINNEMTVGDFTLYSGATLQLINSLFLIINNIVRLYDHELKISNYREFLSWTPRISNGQVDITKKIKNIEFRNVSFKYPGSDNYVLKNINLKFSTNEKIALVGLNGAGKSTLVKLLLRFYDPTEGAIFADGIDIRAYNIDKYRKTFGVMFQEITQYAFSLKENITISDIQNKNDDDRFYYACKFSEIDKMLKKLNCDVERPLTRWFEEDGLELSFGELQKISIARAFFRRSNMIILDEPTSSLDPEAESSFFKNVTELCSDKGFIYITHRLSNVHMADKIIVIENGIILEQGSHAELLSNAGRYSYLFNLQAEKYLA